MEYKELDRQLTIRIDRALNTLSSVTRECKKHSGTVREGKHLVNYGADIIYLEGKIEAWNDIRITYRNLAGYYNRDGSVKGFVEEVKA